MEGLIRDFRGHPFPPSANTCCVGQFWALGHRNKQVHKTQVGAQTHTDERTGISVHASACQEVMGSKEARIRVTGQSKEEAGDA